MIVVSLAILASAAQTEFAEVKTVRRYNAPEARQAVAVDAQHFYAITNAKIGKYLKSTGERVAGWEDKTGTITHLNSGVVVGKKLYCCGSNYPEIPMVGEVEIFDTESLKHVGTHSFGLDAGSATWIDWRSNAWWVVFGHYNGKGGEPGRKNDQTVLVKYDREFRKLESWVFPRTVIDRWDGMTSSGGYWTSRGTLMTSGHHTPELYELRLPSAGSVLQLVRILKSECEGQGISADPKDPSAVWGIQRKTGEVLVGKLP
jgi:hypothetical protein